MLFPEDRTVPLAPEHDGYKGAEGSATDDRPKRELVYRGNDGWCEGYFMSGGVMYS